METAPRKPRNLARWVCRVVERVRGGERREGGAKEKDVGSEKRRGCWKGQKVKKKRDGKWEKKRVLEVGKERDGEWEKKREGKWERRVLEGTTRRAQCRRMVDYSGS
jgi:hypothetical protein